MKLTVHCKPPKLKLSGYSLIEDKHVEIAIKSAFPNTFNSSF